MLMTTTMVMVGRMESLVRGTGRVFGDVLRHELS